MTVITVDTWGSLGLGTIRVRWTMGHWTDAIERSIERRTGMAVWRLMPDGTALGRDGKAARLHYCSSYGRRVPRRLGGGVSVYGQIWVSVDPSQLEDES